MSKILINYLQLYNFYIVCNFEGKILINSLKLSNFSLLNFCTTLYKVVSCNTAFIAINMPSFFCIRYLIHVYRNTNMHLIGDEHMWLDLPKGILYAHYFKSHFLLPFDRYNNRLTVHACNIAKASTVYFY